MTDALNPSGQTFRLVLAARKYLDHTLLASNSRTTWEPTVPVPPITRIFIIIILLYGLGDAPPQTLA